MKNRVFFCSALVGFWMLAAPAQSTEDLKAYYEGQKAEIAKNFTGPELKSEITIVLKDGEEKTGVLRQLSDNGVQLLADGALVTYRKRELSEASCAKLFAEEYAHAEAIKRTRAYKRGHSKRVQGNTHKASLRVNPTNKRTSFNETENKEVDEGSWNNETKTRNMVKTLTVSIANQMTHADTYTLKWYFFAQALDQDNVVIQSRGSEEIKLGGRQQVKRKIVSKEYSTETITSNWTACCGMSTSSQKRKGVEERGYLVVLKCGDEVVDRQASTKRYLDPDWLKLF